MSKATILIIEDDAILALHLGDILARRGYGVAGPLASGEEAVSYIATDSVDLVLMDIELSGKMNGITAAQLIQQTRDIPIIFLTGFSHDPLLEKAKLAAPYGYLIKPVPERELTATIEMTLHRHSLHLQLKESKDALEKNEAKYRHLFHEMLDGFALHEIICDDLGNPVDYRFLAVNPAFERITGLKAADIIGKCVLKVLPEVEHHWIKRYGHVALTGEPTTFENHSSAFDKYFEVRAYRPAPQQFACIFSDVTERRRAEEERISLNNKLQQAQKMEAIGTLAGGIAHDFNNILGAILGYADMANDDISSNELLCRDISQIIKAGNRAKDLVSQILSFSRQVDSEPVPVSLATIVREVIKLLDASLPKTIKIQLKLDTNSGNVLADPSKIHQVIMNLCTNAFHAMETSGGTLNIRLHKITMHDSELMNEQDIQEGEFVQLIIEDDGPGIPPEILDKIFEPYFTTKPSDKGTGLGLAIVHGIVRSFGGFITCQSSPGEATVFRIHLPAIKEEDSLTLPLSEAVVGGSEHILFVDDEQMLTELAQEMLGKLGYKVTACTDSLQALAILERQPEAVDLVITDQTMPGLTGVDLARQMLHRKPRLPIILCTGYSSQVSEELLRSIGVSGYVLKPFNKYDISTLIRRALDEHSPSNDGKRALLQIGNVLA